MNRHVYNCQQLSGLTIRDNSSPYLPFSTTRLLPSTHTSATAHYCASISPKRYNTHHVLLDPDTSGRGCHPLPGVCRGARRKCRRSPCRSGSCDHRPGVLHRPVSNNALEVYRMAANSTVNSNWVACNTALATQSNCATLQGTPLESCACQTASAVYAYVSP